MVEVAFRPGELTFDALLEHATRHGCDQRVFARNDAQLAVARAKLGERAARLAGEPRVAQDSDQHYYLGRSHLRFVPLTPLQAQRVNAALGTDGDPEALLSPRQRALAQRVRAALDASPEVLDGLARPAALGALDEYQVALSERLDAAARPR